MPRKLFRWEKGRQNTGYLVFTMLNSNHLAMDMHLLAYPTGSQIPPHKDPLNFDQRHYRINVEVRRPEKGGLFECGKCIFRWGRIAFFRPDLETHSVTKIEKGHRLVLSLGWKRPPKEKWSRDSNL